MVKDILNYEGIYTIDTNGIIRNKKGKIIKPFKNEHGYLIINIYDSNGFRKKHKVHRLVMATFSFVSDLTVDHKNNNKEDNSLYNLRYMPMMDNLMRRFGYSEPKRYFYDKEIKRFVVRFKVNGKFILYGKYKTESEAINRVKEVLHKIQKT